MSDRLCWIIGRKATLAANGHEYPAQPFIVFESEDDAIAACEMVERVSGERPMMAEAPLWPASRRGSHPGRSAGGKARAAALTPARQSEIASNAANNRWAIRATDTP